MTPEGWSIVAVGDVVELINGRGFTPAEWGHSGLPIIRIQNMNGSTEFNYTEVAHDEKIRVRPGDLLFSWSGNRGTSFGPHLWRGPEGLLNQHIFRVIPKGTSDLSFINAALRRITEDIEAQAHGGSGLVHIKKSELVKFTLPLPPLPEQKKIAAILGSVDEAIQATQAVIDQTRKVKQGLLQQLLTRGIGHTRFKKTEIGEIPEEWELVYLGDIVAQNGLQTGPFGSQLHAHEYTLTGVPVVMPKDMVAGIIVADTIARIPEERALSLGKHKLLENDIVFGRRGDIGRCGLVTSHQVGWICGTGCLRARLGERINSRYLIQYLRQPVAIGWLNGNAVGQTMLNISTEILARLPVPLPPQAEQEQIAAAMEGVQLALIPLSAEQDQLLEIKRGLMQDLLTGRVRVKGVA